MYIIIGFHDLRMSHMLAQLGCVVSDVSVLRRMLFAVTQLPHDFPSLWETVVLFGVRDKSDRNTITPNQAKVLFENLSELNIEAFVNDTALLIELSQLQLPSTSQPLGIILISPKTTCYKCGGHLSIRADRPSQLVIYDDKIGTVPGSHYHKYCRRPHCRVYQHYGYHTSGDKGHIVYDNDWISLPYFISSQKTAFALPFLRNFDAQLFIGQMSYKQGAEIYNYLHGYEISREDGDLDQPLQPTGVM